MKNKITYQLPAHTESTVAGSSNAETALIPVSSIGNNKTKIFKHDSPANFAAKVSHGRWLIKPHLEMINKALVRASSREIFKIMVNLPPRHGKSELISKYFPAWYLGNFPDHRIIMTTHTGKFAGSWGRQVRDILKRYGKEYFDIGISPNAYAVNSFAINDQDGGMDSVGSLGSITGKGADLFIIDDPVKGDKDANSKVMRENLWDWYRSTAFTRLEPNGIIVLIMTRWHEDDICGRILESEKDWQIIKLPAIAELNDPLGRIPGTPLWEERYNLEALLEKKSVMGIYWFSSLFQQSPAPAEGMTFFRKNIRYFREDNEFYYLEANDKHAKQTIAKSDCSIIATCDLAVSTASSADYTVMIISAITPMNDILIKEVIRERIEGAQHLEMVKRVFDNYHPKIIGIESGSFQTTLVKHALNVGLPVSALIPDKDKNTRALAIASRMESGKVFFRKEAPWLGTFEDELLSFPYAKHDDQVDAFAYIAILIYPQSGVMPIGKKSESRQRSSIAESFK